MMRLAQFSLFLALLFASPRVGLAQEQTEAQRRATARALFAEGVAFAEQEQWAEAADRFRRTMDLHPTPVVAFNLAMALVELGRLVEAAEHLRMTQRFPGAEARVRREARAALAEIEPRIGGLRVLVVAMPSGAHVERDGQVLTRAEIGVEVPADPGSHQIRLVQGGETLEERDVELAPGAREEVRLGADLTPAAVAGASDAGASVEAPSEVEETDSGGGGSVLEEWWLWTLIGVVVVGAAVGIGVGVGVSGAGQGDPIAGDLDPPILRGMVMP